MGKITVHQIGNIKIKIDTKDDIYFDAKEPHISLEENGKVTVPHLSLSSINNIVGKSPDEKKAIYWIRENKNKLEKIYYDNNR